MRHGKVTENNLKEVLNEREHVIRKKCEYLTIGNNARNAEESVTPLITSASTVLIFVYVVREEK